jgi:hypothetical protein
MDQYLKNVVERGSTYAFSSTHLPSVFLYRGAGNISAVRNAGTHAT